MFGGWEEDDERKSQKSKSRKELAQPLEAQEAKEGENEEENENEMETQTAEIDGIKEQEQQNSGEIKKEEKEIPVDPNVIEQWLTSSESKEYDSRSLDLISADLLDLQHLQDKRFRSQNSDLITPEEQALAAKIRVHLAEFIGSVPPYLISDGISGWIPILDRSMPGSLPVDNDIPYVSSSSVRPPRRK